MEGAHPLILQRLTETNLVHTDGQNGIWTWGLKVYSSTDLCNWEDRGFLIPPVLEDPNCALFPAKRVDRPHILKCDKTGKYVCWIKLSDDYLRAKDLPVPCLETCQVLLLLKNTRREPARAG